MRFLIKFSYDGTNYFGFQTQKNLATIQEHIETALKKINNNKITPIIASGRTDRGVHALCQCGHVDLDVNISEKQLKRALNSNLPNDIYVIETNIVPSNFHARYNAKSKEYKYIINVGKYNPLERNYVFQYNYPLNIEAMAKSLKYYEGTHDFRAFATDSKNKENCIRTITKTHIEKDEEKITISFIGNGFLRHQVRNMVGLLISVGENKIEPLQVKEILTSKDRTKYGKTAPAEGLYLVEVKY